MRIKPRFEDETLINFTFTVVNIYSHTLKPRAKPSFEDETLLDFLFTLVIL